MLALSGREVERKRQNWQWTGSPSLQESRSPGNSETSLDLAEILLCLPIFDFGPVVHSVAAG